MGDARRNASRRHRLIRCSAQAQHGPGGGHKSAAKDTHHANVEAAQHQSIVTRYKTTDVPLPAMTPPVSVVSLPVVVPA